MVSLWASVISISLVVFLAGRDLVNFFTSLIWSMPMLFSPTISRNSGLIWSFDSNSCLLVDLVWVINEFMAGDRI